MYILYVWWCVPPLSCPTHVQEVQGFQSTAQVERLLLEHGERVVDRLEAEIDRIEIKIKVGVGQGVGQLTWPDPLCLVHTCTQSSRVNYVK